MKTRNMKITHCLKYALLLLSSLAYAAPDAVTKKVEAEKASPEAPENLVLSVVAADWNGDKLVDAAVLMRSGDQADLYLYLANKTGEMESRLVKKNLVWSGAMAGTSPHLKATKEGGLLIYSENDAIGRNRWHQHLSVDYRDDNFIVTGYTYDELDTLEPKSNSSCDVNLLTGKGIKDKKDFKIDAQKIKLSDWADEKVPKQCRN